MNTFFDIVKPDGSQKRIDRSTLANEPLSDWLEKHKVPLNTRCGGRGICRGCLVQPIQEGKSSQLLRSCQIKALDLPPEISRLQIPPASIRDESILGVSEFELENNYQTTKPGRKGIGLSLDIGTTTVAGTLWDLSEGHCLASGSVGNAQRRYGDNVVSRIQFCVDHADGTYQLQDQLLKKSLKPLLTQLCKDAGIPIFDITEANAVGNPTMLHIFAGESPTGLATYPFQPVFLKQHVLPLKFGDLGIHCPITLLPGIAPFVGSDLTAGALATGLLSGHGSRLLIDFGTNGEILLCHENKFYATATAAGPAFEGGNLACGSVASPGVVAALTHDSDSWYYRLVPGGNSKRPKALSGAAYVDFIAIGSAEGWIHPSGRLEPNHPIASHDSKSLPGRQLRVNITEDLYISEADIAELLQAKAAIAAGIAVLMEEAGVTPTELEKVFVGGGFGYHLSPTHARKIGLLPDVSLDRISLVGNSALGGASLCLLYPEHLNRIDDFLANVRSYELNQQASFSDHFTDALFIP